MLDVLKVQDSPEQVANISPFRHLCMVIRYFGINASIGQSVEVILTNLGLSEHELMITAEASV